MSLCYKDMQSFDGSFIEFIQYIECKFQVQNNIILSLRHIFLVNFSAALTVTELEYQCT